MTFDPCVAMNEAAETFKANPYRRLTFQEQCVAFAYLSKGVSGKAIEKAFGITNATVSHLRAARYRAPHDGDQNRYPDVVREFERLGEETFQRTYYTEEMHKRIMQAKYDILENTKAPRRPNPNADKYGVKSRGYIETKSGELFMIKFVNIGWFWVDVPDRDPKWKDTKPSERGSHWCGEESHDEFNPDDPMPKPRPYHTSSAAHNGLLRFVGERK